MTALLVIFTLVVSAPNSGKRHRKKVRHAPASRQVVWFDQFALDATLGHAAPAKAVHLSDADADLITEASASQSRAVPPINALALTPDRESIVVGSQAGLELRATADLSLIRRFPRRLLNVHALAFAPDGKALAVAGGAPAEAGAVEVFDWPAGTLRFRALPHRDLIHAVSWDSSNNRLVTASADKSLALLDAATGKSLHVFEGHAGAVTSICHLPGTNLIVSASVDETLRVWDTDTGKLVRTLSNHTKPVLGVAAAPPITNDGVPVIASIGEDRTVRFWQPTRGRLVRFLRLPAVPLAIAWTSDGKTLVVSHVDGRIRLIDPETLAVKRDLPAIIGWAQVMLMLEETIAFVGGHDGQLRRVALDR